MQRGRWQRSTSNPKDRQATSKNDDDEDQEIGYKALEPRGMAGMSTMQGHAERGNAAQEELLPFGVDVGVAIISQKNPESADKGQSAMSSEPNNNQICQPGRTSHLGAQGSFQPNGPYYIRESQGNEES